MCILCQQNEEWLHLEVEYFDDESNHTSIDYEKQEANKEELKILTRDIFGDTESMTYSEIAKKYEELTGKSYENGKKKIKKMLYSNLIYQNEDKMYLQIKNEIPL
jgi:hypothetical protein